MKTKITFVALMLCTSFILRAQVEQVAQQLAENEYQKFVEELPNAFAKGKTDLFGNAKALKKQFLLEDNAKVFADYLGWDRKKYSQKTLSSVFQALSNNAKPGKNNPNPVSVTFDFPIQPTGIRIMIPKDKKGPNVEKKATVVSYVVTTKADVQVEAQRQGVQSSVAYNNLALIWDGRIRLVNGVVDAKKTMPPILRTIVIGSVTDSSESIEEPRYEEIVVEPKIADVVVAVEEPKPEFEPDPVPPVSQTVTQPVVSQPATQPTPQPVSRPVPPSGREYYKVQILLLQSYIPPAELPERFRVENLTVERYNDGYKYVISANNLNDAFAIKNRMNARGIHDAWIAVYENGVRVRPYQGQPENVY